MLQVLPLHEVTKSTLFLESAITDVLCVVLTFGLVGGMASGAMSGGRVAGAILAAFVIASMLGVAGAIVFLRLLDRVKRMPSPRFTMLAYVFVVYGVAESLGFSGAIAALALGFTLANYEALGLPRLIRLAPVGVAASKNAYEFLADIIFLLKTFFFVYLGISIRFGDWRTFGYAAGLVVAVFLARLVVVRLVVSRRATRADAAVMAIMVPKGLAAAVLATVPGQFGLAQGPLMEQFVYMAVFLSVVVTSLLVPVLHMGPIGRLYGAVLAPFPTGLPPGTSHAEPATSAADR
jgi:NhaP-type Na+/H+ or K+/H+ antiporter